MDEDLCEIDHPYDAEELWHTARMWADAIAD